MSAPTHVPEVLENGPRADLRPLALGLLIPAIVALILTLFIWPALNAEPRELELGVVGSSSTAEDVAASLETARPNAFVVTAYPDADSARQAVLDRDVAGALVPGEPATALTAGAGTPYVARIVEGAAQAVSPSALPVVEDVAPLPSGDPRGVVLAGGGMLPLTIAGIALGAVTGLQRVRTRVRLSAAAIGAVASGLLFVVVMQTWLDALGGSSMINAGAVALAVAAVALPMQGVIAWLGTRGIGLAALVMVIFGNALSGAATTPDLLPTGFGLLGQMLPAGASASLLRSTSGFDGAGATGPALVLAAWAVLGACLVAFRRAPVSGHGHASSQGRPTTTTAASAAAHYEPSSVTSRRVK